MGKIIREKFENGVLVSREVEQVGSDGLQVAKLCVQIVMAIGICVIAVLSVHDSLALSGMVDQAGMVDSACQAPRLSS